MHSRRQSHSGRAGEADQEGPPPDPARELSAPDIPGVVKGGTKVQFIRANFNGTEGVITMPDGSVLFTEQDADKIIKIDAAGTISTYLENTNRTVGLAYDSKGRLIGTQSRDPKVGVLHPTRTVLADSFEGQPLGTPQQSRHRQEGGHLFQRSDPGRQSIPRAPARAQAAPVLHQARRPADEVDRGRHCAQRRSAQPR